MTDSSPDTGLSDGLRLERSIRVPPTVSPHAQAVITAGQQMVVDRLEHPPVSPPLDDAEAWKAHIAFMDEAIVTGFAASALDIPATVEAREIAGVHVNVITPEGVDAGDDAVIHLDIHGGALVAGGGAACRLMNTSAAARAATAHVGRRLPHAARPPLPRAAR